MNNEQMIKVSAWLDGLLTEEEMKEFQQNRALNSRLDQECSEMEAIIKTLATMDEDLQPSPQFRSSLMQRLSAEQSMMLDQNPSIALQKEVDEMTDKSTVWQKIKKGFNTRKFKTWVPATVGVCVLAIVVTIGFNPNGYMHKNSRSDLVAPSAPAKMDRGMVDFGGIKIGSSTSGAGSDGNMDIMNNRSVVQSESADQEIMPPILPPDTSGSVDPKQQEQKIIYSGNIGLEVDSYEDSATTLKTAVEEMGGYVVNENRYNIDDKGRLAGDLTLRIPYQHFNTLLNQAGYLGKVTHQSTNARDVTTEFVDVQARLKVMDAKEERLLELLKQTGSLADVLAVEQELANTRAELESLKGQLRYLTNQTDYSTLNVNLREKPLAASEIQVDGLAGLGLRLKEAFLIGVNGLLSFISDLLVWLVGALPGLIMGALVLWVVWIKWLKAYWYKWRKPNG